MSDKGLPVVNAKEVVKVLEKVGFKRTRQSGSHAVYKREGGKEEFVGDFESQLSKSPYWPEVIALSK